MLLYFIKYIIIYIKYFYLSNHLLIHELMHMAYILQPKDLFYAKHRFMKFNSSALFSNYTVNDD